MKHLIATNNFTKQVSRLTYMSLDTDRLSYFTILKQVLLCISLTLPLSSWAQLAFSGKVIDAKTSVPITSAIVLQKGTTNAVLTDIDGRFVLSIKENISELTVVVERAGYLKQEVKVKKGVATVIKLVRGTTKINTNTNENEAAKSYSPPPSPYIQADVTDSYIQADASYIQADAIIERKVRVKPASSSVAYMIAQAEVPNDEQYGSVKENTFQNPLIEALSTFSIDVDKASYANMRRFIHQGQTPPSEAIRTEELINYFNYNYPEPKNNQPIHLITELGECPWNSKHRLAHIGVKAKEIAKDQLPASHLVFLIDVSGSMSGSNRLPFVKKSFKLLLNQLREIDRVSVVTYANGVQVLMENVKGNQRDSIATKIDQLQASGGTSGGSALQLAYTVANKYFIKKGNNRVILATDGDFNIGVSRDEDLETLIEKESKTGVFLTVLGYGMGNYKDKKMQVLAQKGNGNHAYIDNMQEAEKVLVTEFAGSIFTVAKDVKIQVEFNPAKVQAYRLIGYESRLLNKEDFNNDKKDAGDMGAGHTVTALYEIIPVGVQSSFVPTVDPLKYQNTPPVANFNYSSELFTLKLRYKSIEQEKSELITVAVKDQNKALKSNSDNFRFSAAVAEVGLLLHNSDCESEASYPKAIELAEGAYGEDKEGDRHEFVKLIKSFSNYEL